MLRNEASVASIADASFLSMTKCSGLLQIKKDFHSYQVYLTRVCASKLQKTAFVIPALYIDQSGEIVTKPQLLNLLAIFLLH